MKKVKSTVNSTNEHKKNTVNKKRESSRLERERALSSTLIQIH